MSQEIFDKAKQIQATIKAETPKTLEELEQFRIKYLGTKGLLKGLFGEIRHVDKERKREFGLLANAIKQETEAAFQQLKDNFEAAEGTESISLDLTAPAEPNALGSRHPISIVMNQIVEIFQRIGFVVAEDREIEDDWHNFTAMNTPADHPARDMQDTFYVMNDPGMLLRTHTSSVQSRVMTKTQPPIRIIAPGRVYRNETISARSHCQFHQVEGLYVAENVSFADMKQTLYYFAKELYGATKIRLRPSYFPFTEPSAEMDVYWGLKDEIDYKITKGTGWLEVLGCGMVDPAVLENCGIDSKKYTGFAFGMGIERQAMLKYRISDIRYLFENDKRFLNQFSAAL